MVLFWVHVKPIFMGWQKKIGSKQSTIVLKLK
jgi:hypothetical protein